MLHHCLCGQARGRAEDQVSLLSMFYWCHKCFHFCTIDLLLTHSAFLFDSLLFPDPHIHKCDPGQILLFRLKQQEDTLWPFNYLVSSFTYLYNFYKVARQKIKPQAEFWPEIKTKLETLI